MSISFNGKVYLVGNMRTLSRRNEVNQMRRYAKENDCDVVVFNRDYYMDDTGIYETIISKEDGTTGTNNLFSKIFDFKAKNPFKSANWPINLK